MFEHIKNMILNSHIVSWQLIGGPAGGWGLTPGTTGGIRAEQRGGAGAETNMCDCLEPWLRLQRVALSNVTTAVPAFTLDM